MKKIIVFLLCLVYGSLSAQTVLDGEWEYGLGRRYSGVTDVPGICLDPEVIHDEALWYRKTIRLPEGEWTDAVLELKGARFRPKVYVDGKMVSNSEGGMGRTYHALTHPSVRPGAIIGVEIELSSLRNVPKEDASYIPEVDQWRSNCSSCLWDDVVLHVFSGARVDRVLDFYSWKDRKALLRYRVRGEGASKAEIIISKEGKAVFHKLSASQTGENDVIIDCSSLQEWSPKSPACYDLTIKLLADDGCVLSEYSQTLGFRDFRVSGKQFELNGRPCKMRGGSVVWHRWVRDEDSRKVAFDTTWFSDNILKRIKAHGGNYIRYHLGVPPERILDLCDRLGLAVQYEWSFFHGMPASYESLMEQYAAWLDMASRHPSVCLLHPYNETDEKELATAWKALDELLPEYPDMVLEDRDVLHIHRYWWGMSENLGLYFDSYKQFVKPIMVDEFGGIYLGKDGEMGSYPMVAKGMKRWLGAEHTASARLHHQELAAGKVGEYWRRLGAAGVAAFPIASSFEDGNNWFSGELHEGNPKPVWDAMTVVWADRTVSMNVWDRNFCPGQETVIPLHFINDSNESDKMKVALLLKDSSGGICHADTLIYKVKAHSMKIRKISLKMPDVCGDYLLSAQLLNPSPDIRHDVISKWEISVIDARPSEELLNANVFIPWPERELRKMARNEGLKLVKKISQADVVLMGRYGFEHIDRYRDRLEAVISGGASVVMLDAGSRTLGKSYRDGARNVGQVSGAPKLKSAEITRTELFAGVSLTSVEQSEPESHIHPSSSDSTLWNGLSIKNTWLWNGLRGGVIVPAASIEIEGLSQEAFLADWESKGADADRIRSGSPYYAYDYCGLYRYSDRPDNMEIEKSLRNQVAFLIEDMPALELSLPVHTPVRVTDLKAGYEINRGGRAAGFTPLAVAGKDLVRVPVVEISFGQAEGHLILSQLITEGRLAEGHAPYRKACPLKYDEAAVQFVLNILDKVL